jgi:(1->4)-alpha-D-glucan 1-alpha-D-glucosylmutase
VVKAIREAMVHTRWTRPNQKHEDALQRFVGNILSSELNAEFLHEFRQFQKKIAYFGMINGLSQTLLKIASPGVADFYQGSELWDLRLVDPDNRGAVNFDKRMAVLEAIANPEPVAFGKELHDLVDYWQDGRVKMYLIWRAVNFRSEHQDLFREGTLVPIEAAGKHAHNVIAFLRRKGEESAMVLVPRFLSQVCATICPVSDVDWGDTVLILPQDAPLEWSSVLTGTRVVSQKKDSGPSLMVNDLLREFPVALCSG